MSDEIILVEDGQGDAVLLIKQGENFDQRLVQAVRELREDERIHLNKRHPMYSSSSIEVFEFETTGLSFTLFGEMMKTY